MSARSPASTSSRAIRSGFQDPAAAETESPKGARPRLFRRPSRRSSEPVPLVLPATACCESQRLLKKHRAFSNDLGMYRTEPLLPACRATIQRFRNVSSLGQGESATTGHAVSLRLSIPCHCGLEGGAERACRSDPCRPRPGSLSEEMAHTDSRRVKPPTGGSSACADPASRASPRSGCEALWRPLTAGSTRSPCWSRQCGQLPLTTDNGRHRTGGTCDSVIHARKIGSESL